AGVGERETHALRRTLALGRRLRHVVGVAVGAVADHLGVDPRPARTRVLELLEDEDTRTLGDDEAVAAGDARAAPPPGPVVQAGRERAHRAEAPDAEQAHRRLGAARQHDVLA